MACKAEWSDKKMTVTTEWQDDEGSNTDSASFTDSTITGSTWTDKIIGVVTSFVDSTAITTEWNDVVCVGGSLLLLQTGGYLLKQDGFKLKLQVSI